MYHCEYCTILYILSQTFTAWFQHTSHFSIIFIYSKHFRVCEKPLWRRNLECSFQTLFQILKCSVVFFLLYWNVAHARFSLSQYINSTEERPYVFSYALISFVWIFWFRWIHFSIISIFPGTNWFTTIYVRHVFNELTHETKKKNPPAYTHTHIHIYVQTRKVYLPIIVCMVYQSLGKFA